MINDKPTIDFLNELVERARRYGWSGDYTELAGFIEDLHQQAGLDFRMPEPYPCEEE